jgi:hypothetical protein
VTPAARIAPTAIIVIVGVLSAAGVIDPGLSLALQGMVVAFVLGAFWDARTDAERSRKVAVARTEQFLAWGHEALAEDRVPEQERDHLEHALSAAQELLGVMDSSAPITVKLRRKLEARRA